MAIDTLFRIEHGHGLGDAVALTSVLRNLRAHHAGCRIELIVNEGREGLYRGLADEVTSRRDELRPPTHKLAWPLPFESYRRWPSTYAERCLLEAFGLEPLPDYWGYLVMVAAEDRAAAHTWLQREVEREHRFALCHFRGQSGTAKKNVNDRDAAAICAALAEAGYTVLVWDANDKTPLPEAGLAKRVPPSLCFSPPPLVVPSPTPPAARMDAARLAALIQAVDLFVGIDSGPLHLASAVGTRAIGLWRYFHPLHCFCPDRSTTHLIQRQDGCPEPERFLIRRPIQYGLEFFREHYQHVHCDQFAPAIAELLARESRA